MKVIKFVKLKTNIEILFFLLFAFWLLPSGLPESAVAQSTLRNDFYIIRMGNLNVAAGRSEGSGRALNITVGQIAPGLYTGDNYTVRAGFQYISSIIPFSFTISSDLIDFGDLTPTNPVTRTNTLTVSNQSAGGYIVTASENHQLLVPASGAVIPDTTCDNGTCTEEVSSAWTSSLTFGFGYRCDAITDNFCASGFEDSTYFKQFADKSIGESAQTIMQGASGRSQESQITYKVNISAIQPAGFYSNVITYIATPTY